jgi:tRNA dimethylallyltransferase
LQVAKTVDAEILNFDSRQVYADFPCVTAQPSAQEQKRCRHHLYGFLPTKKSMDAGKFTGLARSVIQDIFCRGKLPILVGGTGLYLRALVYGLAPIPDIPQEMHDQIMNECRTYGPEALYRRLQAEDPETAARLHPRDRQRITRALEVKAGTGRPLSWWIREYPCDTPRYTCLHLGLWADLEELTPRLEARIEQMMAQGAMQEIERAWDGCPDESAPGWSGIGCFELLQVLLGRWSWPEARQAWLKNTRAYAKRQLTWFKKVPDIHWLGWTEVNLVSSPWFQERVNRLLRGEPGCASITY